MDHRSAIKDRYIQLLKSMLLNEIYMENDVRSLYIFSMLFQQRTIDPEILRSVATRLPRTMARVKEGQQNGSVWWRVELNAPGGGKQMVDLRNVCQFSHTMVGRKRLNNIEECIRYIQKDNIPGDFAETGVWRGGACIFMKGCITALEMQGRILWVADSFEGLPVPRLPEDIGYDFSVEKVPILAISLEEVQDNFRRYGLLDDDVKFLKGWFNETLPCAPIERLALLRLDGDLYESTIDALNALYHKVSPGGFVIVDDYGDFEPCRRAIHDFRERHDISEPIEEVDWTCAFWRKRL
jgi:O-methyltransferase